MMKNWKRGSAIVAAALMMVLPSCAGNPSATAPSQTSIPASNQAVSTQNQAATEGNIGVGGAKLNDPGVMPIVSEPVEVNILVKGNSHVDTNELISMIEMEKRSGVKVNFEDIPSNTVTERIGLAFASNDMPDAFMRMGLPSDVLVQQYQNKNIVAVSDYLDQMPNFSKVLDENILAKGLLPQPDGTILSMPQMTEVVGSLMVNKMFINQKWLEALDLQQPKTLDEVYSTLVAFRDNDPNGNGQKDEVPWTTSSAGHTIGAWAGAFGLRNGGSWDRFDHNPEDPSKLRFIYTAPELKELLTFVNKLYTEGLMLNTVFDSTQHGPLWLAHVSSNEVGMFNEINSQFAGDYMQDFVGLDEPYTGPGGEKLWTGYRGSLLGQGNFVVTSAAEHPDVLFRWIDYFYGLEGARLYFLGIEGDTYEPAANGLYQFTDEYRLPKDGLTFDQSVGRVTLYPGGGNPSYCFNDAYGGGESLPETVEASEKMLPFVPKVEDLIPSSYNFTPDASKVISTFNADVYPIIEKAMADFIIGNRDLSEFDAYVAEVEGSGLQAYIDVIQSAYDNYLENSKK